MFLRLFFDGLVEPFWFALLTLVSITIPSTLVIPFSRLVRLRFPMLVVYGRPIPPALGPIESLTGWLRFIVVIPRPGGICSVPVQAVPTWPLAIFTVLVLCKVAKVTAGPITAVVTIVLLAWPSFPAKTIRAVAHATMETFGAFLAKTLARFDCTPSVAILVSFTATAEATSSIAVSVTVAESIIGVGIAIPATKSEAIPGLSIFRLSVAIERLLASRMGSRGEKVSRGPKDYILGV